MNTNISAAYQDRFELSLFLLRLGVFIVMFAWTVAKFFAPDHAMRYFERFFMIPGLVEPIVYILGAIELIILLAFLAGMWKRYTYGLITFFHGVSTLSAWNKYIIPAEINMMFYAAWPMFAACITLYLLRDLDVKFTVRRYA